MVEIIDILVEFDVLELAHFLDGLFRNILHDRRIVDGLHGELEGRRSLATFRVGRDDSNRLGTVPEFARSLERNFAGLIINVDLDILVAGNFELQLGEIVVGVAHVFIENDRGKFSLFFDGLVRNLLEYRDVVDGLHGEGHLLLDGCAFRVRAGECHVGRPVPVRIRDFNGGDAAFVDVHIERTPFRFLALVLHVGFPGEFRILVVGILHIFVKLDLGEGLLFVDGLTLERLREFRLVVHGVHSEAVFGFGASTGRVADLELDGFRAIP